MISTFFHFLLSSIPLSFSASRRTWLSGTKSIVLGYSKHYYNICIYILCFTFIHNYSIWVWIIKYRQLHKTLPRSSEFLKLSSVRFYETGCIIDQNINLKHLLKKKELLFFNDRSKWVFLSGSGVLLPCPPLSGPTTKLNKN